MMEKIELSAGSEKNLRKFILNLKEIDNIISISHNKDLDGIASSKIINSIIKANSIEFIDYSDLNNDLVKRLKEKNFNKIILTDMCFTKDLILKIEEFAEILIIDHHQYHEDLNSRKTTFINAQGYCAAYLCYYLLSKIKDLKILDWLVACASVSDFCFFNNREWMKEIFKKYGDHFEIIEEKNIRKTGKFWDLQYDLSLAIIYFSEREKEVYNSIGERFGEIGELRKYISKVQSEIDSELKIFEKEKTEINGRIFWEFAPKFRIGSILINILSSKLYNRTIIIARKDKNHYNLSGRRSDKGEDMNILMKNLTEGLEDGRGGGHVAAAGGSFLLKDREKFIEKLRKLNKI